MYEKWLQTLDATVINDRVSQYYDLKDEAFCAECSLYFDFSLHDLLKGLILYSYKKKNSFTTVCICDLNNSILSLDIEFLGSLMPRQVWPPSVLSSYSSIHHRYTQGRIFPYPWPMGAI